MRVSASMSLTFAVVAAVGLIALPAAPEARLVDYFIVQYPSISPNGDGIKDSSAVRIGLLGACTELLVTVEDQSTGNPLDTLLRIENAAPGVHTAEWKGENALGGILGEGSYTIRLVASGPGETENLARTAIIDTTAPLVVLDRIEPGIYAPGSPGTPEKVLIYFSISRYNAGDTMSVVATSPDSVKQSTPAEAGGNGAHSAEWSAPASATDGIYRLALFITDQAGNSSADSGSVDVDTAKPTMSFITNIPANTNQVPPAILGKCYDRNGVEKDSLFWDNGKSFLPDSTFMDGDTLVWRFDALDSLRRGSGYKEGSHSLKAKCQDVFGHEADKTLSFKLDLTAPVPPTLRPIPAIIYKPEMYISGSVTKDVKVVYVYREAGGDTTVKHENLIITGFSVLDTLREGENRIWAIARDEAGNLSASSAVETVTYERAAGVSVPEVFRGTDVFRVYCKNPARRVTIEIYTVSGELVATLDKSGPGTDFEIPWNLTNTDGENVRNGPYLVVFTVKYDNGQTMEKRLIAVVRGT